MTARELSLSQLTTELTDFLGLPAELDLPPLYSVSVRRTPDTGWKVKAFLAAHDDQVTWARMQQWAVYTGGTVEVDERSYPASHQPSGMQRSLRLIVVVAEVPVEIVSGVDALFEIPAAQAVAS